MRRPPAGDHDTRVVVYAMQVEQPGATMPSLVRVLGVRRLDVRTEQPPFVTPGGAVIPLLAVAVVITLLASATRMEFLAVGALLAISSVLYLFRRPAREVTAAVS
jgi:hypothetical protein